MVSAAALAQARRTLEASKYRVKNVPLLTAEQSVKFFNELEAMFRPRNSVKNMTIEKEKVMDKVTDYPHPNAR